MSQNAIIPIDVVINLARAELYKAAAIDGFDRVDTAYIAGKIGNGVTAGFVSLAFRQLEDLREITIFPSSTRVLGQLTPAGARQAENELRKVDSYAVLFGREGVEALQSKLIGIESVPASDRMVRRDDNYAAREEAIAAVDEVANSLEKNNAIGEIPDETVPAIIAEVGALKQILSAVSVRCSPALAAARRTLGWISEKAGAAAIGELAKKALALIIGWLS